MQRKGAQAKLNVISQDGEMKGCRGSCLDGHKKVRPRVGSGAVGGCGCLSTAWHPWVFVCCCPHPLPDYMVPVVRGGGKFLCSFHEEIFKILFLWVWDFILVWALYFKSIFKEIVMLSNLVPLTYPSDATERGARKKKGGARRRSPSAPLSQKALG